jgi:predicted TPR repeat methyltransferase
MVAQSQARNAEAIGAGRLELREEDILDAVEPADLMLAAHVIYFWHEPASVLHHARMVLAGGGALALGYRCRRDMPPPARRDFPREGHRLYDSEQDVSALLTTSGFQDVENGVITSNTSALGWLTVGRAR